MPDTLPPRALIDAVPAAAARNAAGHRSADAQTAANSLGMLPGCHRGFGLPGERLAQRAAQRSFLALKQCFEDAAATLDGRRGEWLRDQVQAAQEPIDLWLLRGAVTTALVAAEGVTAMGLGPEDAPTAHRARLLAHARGTLERALSAVFAESLDWPTAEFSAGAGRLRVATG